LMIAMFPANIYASLNDVEFNGAAADPLLQRAFIEMLWLVAAITVATEPNTAKRRQEPAASVEPLSAQGDARVS